MKEMKPEYAIKLKSPLWIQKRNEILYRDKRTCRNCGSKEKLHVHHKRYVSGREPWEIENRFLITLCSACHEKEHEGRNISSFFYKETEAQKRRFEKLKSKPLSKKKRKLIEKQKKYVSPKKVTNKRLAGLSQKDIEIQKKYDALKLKNKNS